MISGSLNLLEPSGPHRTCYWTALPLPYSKNIAHKRGAENSQMFCGFLIHYATGHAAYYNDICTPCQYDWTIKYNFPKPVANKAGGLRVNVTCRCVRVTFCRGQAISIQYSEYVSLAVVAQYAKCMSRILSCSVCFSSIFFHVISYTAHFRGEKINWT